MKHELVIVGGGIIGKALALNLVNNNVKVLLVDPNLNNGIATTAAGGMLGAFGEITYDKVGDLDKKELQFRIDAAKMYPEWIKNLEEMSGEKINHGKGTFIIGNSSSKDDYKNLNFIREQLDLHKEKYEDVDPGEIPGYKPNSKYTALGSLFIPNEGYISSIDLLKALDRALDNSPYYSSMEDYVTTLTLEGNEKEIRTKSGSVIKAEKVVLCSGVGIREILEASNININVPVLLPGKGVSLVVETNYNSEHVIRTPNRDFACGTHVVPRGNGKLYVGATNRIFNTPGVTDGATTGEINSLLHSVLHEINSDLRTNNLTDIKFGSRPISIDRFPLLGETNINGIYVATGTYRNGILMAPLIANIVSDTILSKKTSYFNPFTLEGRIKPSTDQIITNLIDNGVKDLVSFIQEPTGSLPFNRQNELSNFINALLKMVLINDDEQKALISELQDLTQKYPMSEIIPQIYYNLQVK